MMLEVKRITTNSANHILFYRRFGRVSSAVHFQAL